MQYYMYYIVTSEYFFDTNFDLKYLSEKWMFKQAPQHEEKNLQIACRNKINVYK